MIKLYTIGFTKKTAREFFRLLKENNVEKIVDVRLNNTSQLAGFAKYKDLEYLCELNNIEYIHEKQFAPTENLLKSYKKKLVNWNQYTDMYIKTLDSRGFRDMKGINMYNNSCFLCSEFKPNFCHRRLLVEYLASIEDNIIIKHL